MPWLERGQLLKNWLGDFKADWASLQFVPFSFHSKGLKLGLSDWLTTWVKCRNWHIMFHETWVGFTKVSTFKHRAWGAAQRLIVSRMVKHLNPVIIHTSNPLYQIMLSRSGIKAALLIVPSNIPVTDVALVKIKSEFELLGIKASDRKQWTVIGTFGTVHPGHDYIPYFKRLVDEAKGRGQKVAFLMMGRTGKEAQKLGRQLDDALASDLLVHAFGTKSEAEVSAFFQSLDYGLTTVSRPFLGKSGVVAAMKLHGLEILVPRELVLPDYDEDLATYESSILTASSSQFEPAATAGTLLKDLATVE
jgi:hypothetical protein